MTNKEYMKKYRQENRTEYNKRVRDYRKKNPQKTYFVNLKNRYGVTEEWFYRQLRVQDGKCICGFEFKLFSGDILSTPHVDHCHKTNRVRGLLCQKCNTAIGLLRLDQRTIEESVKLFSTILDYLRK